MEKDSQTLIISDTLQQGKYHIDSILGQGGFGITYLATHALLGKKVAIKELFLSTGTLYCTREKTVSKEIKPQFDNEKYTEFKQNFLQEARTLYKLDKVKGIVKIIDIFDENNTSYFVMDYIEGYSLKELVSKKTKLSIEEAINYAEQLLNTLQQVHQYNILHRDIKPDNILIDKNTDTICLIDFGIAREYMTDKTITNTQIMYTPGYAPPEQAVQNAKRGTYSDLYSVGAVLYFCLSGKKPQTSDEIMLNGLLEPKQIDDNIPDWINSIVVKSLRPKPADRFQTAEDFLLALNTKKIIPNDGKIEKYNENNQKYLNISTNTDVTMVDMAITQKNETAAINNNNLNNKQQNSPTNKKKFIKKWFKQIAFASILLIVLLRYTLNLFFIENKNYTANQTNSNQNKTKEENVKNIDNKDDTTKKNDKNIAIEVEKQANIKRGQEAKQAKEMQQRREQEAREREQERLRQERLRQQRENMERERREMLTYRNNIANYLQTNVTYDKGILGGLSNIRVYVKNNSPYYIEQVNVIVEVITAFGDVHSRETLAIKNLSTGRVSRDYASNTKRGTKIKLYVNKVYSPAMELY
ncbi:MAG: serine/threonine protein kinase [Cytophagia bacterium]|nr:MAG: serine/threonine protein kinase [Cytophagia bacterium]